MYWTKLHFHVKNERTLVRVWNRGNSAEQRDDGSWEGMEDNEPLTKENIEEIAADLEERLANIRTHAATWLKENNVQSARSLRTEEAV